MTTSTPDQHDAHTAPDGAPTATPSPPTAGAGTPMAGDSALRPERGGASDSVAQPDIDEPSDSAATGSATPDGGQDRLTSLFSSEGDSPDDVTTPFSTLAVDLDNVTVVYPGATKPALKDVTLAIGVNDFCYLVGASGSGKTTLLKLLTGQLGTTFGHADVLGRDLARLRRRELARLRRRIAVVYQDIALIDTMTVAENIGYALRVAGWRNRNQIDAAVRTALDVVGLGDVGTSRPAELSGGEAQRVAIARAVVTRPELILADEPTGNLDPETSASIVEVFNTIHRSGIPIIMATHDRRLVDYYPHRVIEIDAGTVVRDEAHGSYLRGVKPSTRRYLKTSTAR